MPFAHKNLITAIYMVSLCATPKDFANGFRADVPTVDPFLLVSFTFSLNTLLLAGSFCNETQHAIVLFYPAMDQANEPKL
jgi:hypothetical protein